MPHSLVDTLAEKLSKATGTTFVVDRLPRRPGSGMAPSWYYRIRVSRGDASFSFGETSVNEAKRSLAMVNDLVNMGFIPSLQPMRKELDRRINLCERQIDNYLHNGGQQYTPAHGELNTCKALREMLG